MEWSGEAEQLRADRRFALLFEDLEAQEAGRALHERLGEYSDLVAGEAADHGLADRLAAARGERIAVTVAGVRFEGRVSRAAAGWLLLATGAGGDVLVSLPHVEEAVVRTRGHAETAEGLSLASPLRLWCDERAECAIAVAATGGEARMLVGRIRAVARDYIEVESAGTRPARSAQGGSGSGVLIPQSRIAHVRPTGGVR